MLTRIARAGEFFFFLILTFTLALLPFGVARRFGACAGRLLYRLWGSRRRIALENIGEASSRGALPDAPPPEEIAIGCFENLGVSFVELAKVYYGFGGGLLGSITCKGDEWIRSRQPGRGVIFVTAHAGNWELLALKTGLEFGGIGVVARPLYNPYLNRFLERARARFGNKVIYKKGALRPLLSTLKSGGMAGILMDQAVIKEEGRIIEFLGRGAWTTRMPVVLAKRTGAAIHPAFIKRTASGHEITFCPETDLSGTEEEALRRLNLTIENFVRENPSQWLWIHRRWKRVGPSAAENKPQKAKSPLTGKSS
ncbi:MAG: lysophospholipid acyltransferase family protein [Nitrospiraceae bacterium]|nr:lysophospholipid acyltransferase family protein [Nitrospiraceae bacterium]